jgi:5-methylthioadenosine/S-adenosylhomocysteine deaminase
MSGPLAYALRERLSTPLPCSASITLPPTGRCGMVSRSTDPGAAMEPIDTLLLAEWLVPLDEAICADDVLAQGAVAIRDGRIVAICSRDQAMERFAPARTVDRPGHVLMPGLVNAHTHAAMTLLRGLADDLPLKPWLEEHIWPAETRWVSPAFVRDGVELAVVEMLRSGTTCFGDMYFFPDVAAQVVAASGIRASIGMVVFDMPTAWADDVDDYLRKGLDVRDAYKGDALVSMMFTPHAPYTVSPDTMGRIRRLSDQLEVPVQTHLHETAAEIEHFASAHGCRPLEKMAQLGLLSPLMMAVHLTQAQPQELGILADTGCHVVHCPESNLKLASGACPVAALQDAGVNVALGTDGAASNNDLDLFAEMRTAALLAKHTAADPAALPAAAALRMATINGAQALGLGEQTGSLTPGKWADVICVDMGSANCHPMYHLLSQLVYATNAAQVRDVWVAGRQLVDDRELTRMDVADVLHRASIWQSRIAASDQQRHSG